MTTKNNEKSGPFIRGVTGVILAGGKSSRFGTNKAFADVNGRQLIRRVIDIMGSVFEELIIITNDPGEYSSLGLPMYEDLIKGLGPLGGIYTGLEEMPERHGFFVACDMPFLNEDLIRHITEKISDDLDAVVPKIDWKMEPLHSLYSKTCLPAIKELIDSGECMINRFFQSIRAKFINEDEIRRHDPLMMSFYNINRPGELVEAVNRESIILQRNG
ncbi:MAG: molybdenum cofactor guanylyltransferase [Deltaproteobacteria bacterium]|nr:molybdenum cofactor guanylyltransferase [Deltaproteobacteria bacterium]